MYEALTTFALNSFLYITLGTAVLGVLTLLQRFISIHLQRAAKD